MSRPIKEQDRFIYRPVYLSDLKAIVKLYREQLSDGRYSYHSEELTADFGIPLNVVEYNKKAIAYSAICLDEEQQAHITLVLDKTCADDAVATALEACSLHACRSSHLFMDEEEHFETDKIRHAIQTLTSWLNKC